MSLRCFPIKWNQWFCEGLIFRYLLNSKQFSFIWSSSTEVVSWWMTSPVSWPWLFLGRETPDLSWVSEVLFSGIWKLEWLGIFSLSLGSWNCHVLGRDWQTFPTVLSGSRENKFAGESHTGNPSSASCWVRSPAVFFSPLAWGTPFFPSSKALKQIPLFFKLAWWVTGACSQQTPNWYMFLASGPWHKKVTGVAHSNKIELRL